MSLDMSGGVSRSGRIRKKSTKLKEMEDTEKSGEMNGYSSAAKKRQSDNDLSSNSSGLLNASLTNGSLLDQETPKKRKLKIRFSLDNGGIEEMPIDNEIQPSDLDQRSYTSISASTEPTVPSLKIKLFQNSSDNYVASPPKKKAPATTPRKPPHDSENAANLLFQQITSGHVIGDSKRKSKKKSFADYEENMLFDADDVSSDEEASLVISDSSESLQAALEHAKAVKNPQHRLTETKIATTKSGQVKLKKVDRKDKKQKLSKITAYTLFARENRSRIQQSYPQLDFANVSKRLGEIWQALPQREKMQWKRKAQKQKSLNTVPVSAQQTVKQTKLGRPTNAARAAAGKFVSVRHNPANSINNRNKQLAAQIRVNLRSKTELMNDSQITNHLFEPSKTITTSAIDVASCFKILGDSLNAIGLKLNNTEETLNESDALDLLLDSAVCAMSPLLCLTSLIRPELAGGNEKVQRGLLDNVAFLMPGI